MAILVYKYLLMSNFAAFLFTPDFTCFDFDFPKVADEHVIVVQCFLYFFSVDSSVCCSRFIHDDVLCYTMIVACVGFHTVGVSVVDQWYSSKGVKNSFARQRMY